MLSQLEAVNQMLASLGSAPVNSIEGEVNADVAIARDILQRATTDVLLKGWAFNTDLKVPMAPGPDGRIQVPSNTLKIDVSPSHYTQVNPVQRGDYLYDRDSRSYTFTVSLLMDRVVALKWDELPEVARKYIAAVASSVMVETMDGTPNQVSVTRDREMVALTSLQQNEADIGDYSMLDGHTAQSILRRGV